MPQDVRPLPAEIEAVARTDPDRILLQHTNGSTETYRTFWDRCLEWGGAISAAEPDPGARVVTMLPNSIESYLAWIGSSVGSCVEVALDPMLRGPALAHALNITGARIAIVNGEEQLREIAAVAADLRSLRQIVMVHPLNAENPDSPHSLFEICSLQTFLRQGGSIAFSPPRPDETCTVIFTSGTTGPAKGVNIPWARFQHATPQYFPGSTREADSGGSYYQIWPTHHGSGKLGLVVSVHLGLRMIMRTKFSVSQFWRDVHEYSITHSLLLFGANYLLEDTEWEANAQNTLRQVMMAPLIPDYRVFSSRYSVKVTTGYGQSEVGFAMSTDDPVDHRTVGRPSPGYRLRLVDDLDYDVPPGQPGELVVQHDQPWRLNTGYISMPEKTVEAWRNGWFHTGDIFRRAEDGSMYFVDRVQDYIRSHGENISSYELESVVLNHPEVVECACIGVASTPGDHESRVADQDVKLVAVLREGSQLTGDDLAQFVESKVPPRMYPKYIEFRGSLPRTATNKIKKTELQKSDAASPHWTRP